MRAPLEKEGLTDGEFLAIVMNGPTWADRTEEYDQVTLPVMSDSRGVFYVYGVEPFDVVLVDKKGRLVSRETFTDEAIDPLLRRIRQLHAE